MERLCDEIVRIKSRNSKIHLNSKNDWAQPALVRVIAITGNQLETQQGDDQPGRQERRAARSTPTRRRRRAATEVDTTPTPERGSRSQREQSQQQQEDTGTRRLRRGQQNSQS
jgi:hypothetical protein